MFSDLPVATLTMPVRLSADVAADRRLSQAPSMRAQSVGVRRCPCGSIPSFRWARLPSSASGLLLPLQVALLVLIAWCALGENGPEVEGDSGKAHATDRNCFTAKDHAMRDASGPRSSLKGLLAVPPLHAWPNVPTVTKVAIVVPLRLKSVTDIG